MLQSLVRRAAALLSDDTLRRWAFARLTGTLPPAAAWQWQPPPYLPVPLPVAPAPAALRSDLFSAARRNALSARARAAGSSGFHGVDLSAFIREPSSEIFKLGNDLEFTLAIHRFAWLPANRGRVADDDVQRVWDWWQTTFGASAEGWAWHPYTAAERCLNLLDFLEGSASPALEAALCRTIPVHLRCIADQLEYFGEQATGNHLANNGRGLYRLGLAAGDVAATAAGRQILITEAQRIFGPEGVLREGSSHYHLLASKWYLDCWRWAVVCRDQGEPELRSIAKRALKGCRHVSLGGILPRVGDISPDSPPDDLAEFVFPFVESTAPGPATWLQRLPASDSALIEGLMAEIPGGGVDDREWKVALWGDWRLITYVPLDGWAPLPGHGHSDLGGFQLHWRDQVVVIDPGRGQYGDRGDAHLYRISKVHSVVEVDGEPAYPLNRPVYSDAFRSHLIATPPSCARTTAPTGLRLRHHGFSRYRGRRAAERWWSHQDDSGALEIRDIVDGEGTALITRRIVTPLVPKRIEGGVHLEAPVALRVTGQGTVSIVPVMIWSAYGEGRTGWAIEWSFRGRLPVEARLSFQSAPSS